MWIKTTNEGLKSLYNADLMDEEVVFSESGTAQVPEEVGEQLIEQYDDIKLNED